MHVNFARKIAPYFENIRTPNESTMYKSIIKGSAANFNVTRSSPDITRKVNLILLSCHEKLLNFNAKSSNLDTSSREKTIVITESTTGLYTRSRIGEFRKGSAVMKIAFAGVGSPLKESDCVSSRLKIANLNAEQTAISMAT